MTTVDQLDFELAEVNAREQTRRHLDATTKRVPLATGLWQRRRWMLIVALLVAWSFWDATAGRGALVNPGGWTQVSRFASGALHPELDAEFLKVVARSALTTAGYALTGTALALGIGVVGGVLSSDLWWARDQLDASRSARQRSRTRRPALAVRLLAVWPRGIHEAIWTLIFVFILGRNPLVAVLALGIPFGAITAKVVADTIDVAGHEPIAALRAAGASRLGAMIYGIAPRVLADLTSYGFYRLECALRSSVVLGAIGAGGLGFQLAVSFQALRYNEIWTLIYVLVILSTMADMWGASLRRRPSRRRTRVSVLAALMLTVASIINLGIHPTTLFNERARRLAANLGREAWPPRLPSGGWTKLLKSSVETIQLSVIAISIAASLATLVAFLAARPQTPAAATTDLDGNTAGRRALSWVARVVLLMMRSIPPHIWALIVLFVVFPGPLPGGIALGMYTLGVLGRLEAEVIENADQAPVRALRSSGATRLAAFSYGTLPTVAPRLSALATYRWEVAARETVIVGIVGAGGLGRLLAQQNASFDEAAMLTTVIALVAVSAIIDFMSTRIRLALGS